MVAEQDGTFGHRSRLRRRFLQDRGQSMEDYELVELLLMSAIPRRDVKPLAKGLLRRFGSLSEILAASRSELATIQGLGESSITLLLLVGTCQRRAAKQRIVDQHVVANWEEMLEYCRLSYADLRTEEFHALLLDQQNHILEDLLLGEGSVSDVVIYPREVVKQALDYHAQSMILVHNHPGGSARPSANDIRTTMKLKEALNAVDISLFDHLIIARGGEITSFKSKGLL